MGGNWRLMIRLRRRRFARNFRLARRLLSRLWGRFIKSGGFVLWRRELNWWRRASLVRDRVRFVRVGRVRAKLGQLFRNDRLASVRSRRWDKLGRFGYARRSAEDSGPYLCWIRRN